MPKDRRIRSPRLDQSRASSFPCNSKDAKKYKSENLLGPEADVREWEEARCPICMEHPHSAVLLRCSSHKNGCRPYMCNTGYRHSNCLNEFFKKFATTSSPALPQDALLSIPEPQEVPLSSTNLERTRPCGSSPQPKHECPLCRGQIIGWVVIERARQFLNSKPRSCSYETCDFMGTYPELRKHARLEHPSVRPWEVDQKRKRDWKWLECLREFQDVLSVIQSEFLDVSSGDINLPAIYGNWLTLSFLARSFSNETRESETQ